eukprot:CAMPEP_0177589408 /NCGR_PEP_ID=MMETSP0419_2-20121207/6787_1 /TAXON_ID=582737 /ORGANISM="Tetraselmis sp., Strain GSL018" /LENGTH=152 /DNA_ID=CAMNT_0019079759 /DNA_START=354 /DNA_END=812 /DNA_ORIENTATION=-
MDARWELGRGVQHLACGRREAAGASGKGRAEKRGDEQRRRGWKSALGEARMVPPTSRDAQAAPVERLAAPALHPVHEQPRRPPGRRELRPDEPLRVGLEDVDHVEPLREPSQRRPCAISVELHCCDACLGTKARDRVSILIDKDCDSCRPVR